MKLLGHKVAQLPNRGVLIYATDLQGNLADFHALMRIYRTEKEAGNEPILAFCGDLVHGPSPDMHDDWPDYLGSPYQDASATLIREFAQICQTEHVFSVLGNHEHAHIGGPVVPKFYPDEAAILDTALGDDRAQIHDLFRSFPLVAVAPCGVVLIHGAPGGTEPDLPSFERLDYSGYESISLNEMYRYDTVGAILWSRSASDKKARALLAATQLDGSPNAFVAFGHDVVREGFETVGETQICVSTSFGLFDRHKTYLRLDLGRRYRSVDELRMGHEIRLLYPDLA